MLYLTRNERDRAPWNQPDVSEEDREREELLDLGRLKGWSWVRANCRPDLIPLVDQLAEEDE